VASGSDEVEEHMNTIVAESRITLDARLFGENVVVLAFKIADNFRKAGLVINLVTESRSIDNGQRDARALLVEFCIG
jgi:hypothetical protein